MRRVLLAGVFILPFVTGVAYAADLPSAAPAPAPAPYIPPPVFTWTGFYVGGYVGGEWNNTRFPRNDGAATAPTSLDASGIVGGGIIGGNYQFDNNLVVGVEGDLGASGDSRSNTGLSGGFAVTNHINQDWIGRIRGRAGIAVGNALIFAAGGVSFDNEKLSVSSPGFGTGSASTSRTGWNIGGGVDYAFTNNWFGRIEYIYDNFPGTNYALTNGFASRHVTTNDSTIRVALGYKF